MISSKSRDSRTAYMFLFPAIALLGAFVLYPLVQLLWMSVHDWDILRGDARFVGTANYQAILSDEAFWQSLLNTFIYVAATVPLGVVLSLALALLLNKKLRGVGFLRTAIFTPVVTSTVAAGIIFVWLMDYDTGLLNAFLGVFGIAPINWLQSERWAMPAVVLMTLWKQAGYNMVLFLAGLQAIPDDVYEAAAVDGANTGWQVFRHITLPLLAPTTFFVTIISVIYAFRAFEQMYAMTRGGPVGSTTTLVYYIFDKAFKYGNMGQAAVVATLMVVIVLCVTALQFRLQRQGD
ncbi:MAG: sugar ABC transporter permease [Pyrinomonadaceae bacterium MAG19_C2-C3]|nr:sugar ABC transporter permease [Pyrinomonadaceae bacterium MAG19_C2-C3]